MNGFEKKLKSLKIIELNKKDWIGKSSLLWS
jgi:hypothetical protein